ncbi:hypothetical protein SAMN03159362_2177 [Pseudomonas sp. NFIX51]|nr:hypothetical protein SAMN03159362_2177 [Pseudomonas sp. NFIX51]
MVGGQVSGWEKLKELNFQISPEESTYINCDKITQITRR